MLIELTQGQVAKVDDEDYEEINNHIWYAWWSEDTKSFYAVRNEGKRGSRTSIKMAREIMNAPPNLLVDHINGDTLDNRKENLRIVTRRQNAQNIHKRKSSKYPGVHWDAVNAKWCAKLKVGDKHIWLGRHSIESDAYNAYIDACRVYGFAVDFMLEKFKR